MSAVIDLPRIRRALSELDRIATEHPEICQGLGQWDEKAVAGIVNGKPGSERQAEYRRKLAAQGIKREVFFATPEAQTALAELRVLHPDKTRDNILCDAVINLLAAQQTPIAPPPPAGAPPTFDLTPPSVDSSPDRDATIVALHSTGLSLAQISGKLATMGILSANGCPVSVSTINRVLTANGLKANGELMGKNLIERD